MASDRSACPDAVNANKGNMKTKLTAVLNRIENAARRSGRAPQEIRLVTVGKIQPVHRIREAIEAGAAIIGENYIQEARGKFDALVNFPVQWHFIGHLQSNKAKYAVRMFDLIHSVDSLKLASEINKQAQKAGKVQEILIQVNISGETTKSGVSEDWAADLIHSVSTLPHVRIKGLMTMPPFFDDPDRARPYFAALRRFRDGVRLDDTAGTSLNELSMGMTGDFEVAIEEGATLVRIGTAIFGVRR